MTRRQLLASLPAAALGRLREAMNQWMRQTNDPGDPEKITWRQ